MSEPEHDHCILGHPAGKPAEAFIGMVCRRHYGWIDRTLTEILELFAVLPLMLQPGAAPGGDGSKHGKQPYAPAPIRLEIAALTDSRADTADGWKHGDGTIPDVANVLYGWCRMIGEELPCELPETVDVMTLIRFLRGQAKWIARQSWVDDYANEMHELHLVLARRTGAGLWAQPLGACPNCRTPIFYKMGADIVECRRCKSVWSGVQFARLRAIMDEQQVRAAMDKVDTA